MQGLSNENFCDYYVTMHSKIQELPGLPVSTKPRSSHSKGFRKKANVRNSRVSRKTTVPESPF